MLHTHTATHHCSCGFAALTLDEALAAGRREHDRACAQVAREQRLVTFATIGSIPGHDRFAVDVTQPAPQEFACACGSRFLGRAALARHHREVAETPEPLGDPMLVVVRDDADHDRDMTRAVLHAMRGEVEDALAALDERGRS